MILAVVGPTGVGKTKLSIALAKKYDAIIINCDAMQVYQGLDIGTAKITEEEKEGISHFLFDFVDVKRNYTVYDYQKDARELLEKFANRNIIFVGGTGLYLKAALYDYCFSLETEKQDLSYTKEELYALCLKKDPNCSIHPNNVRRMQRFLQRTEPQREPTLLYDCLFIGLTLDRSLLYQRIDQRVDEMFKAGLLEEVKSFYDQRIVSKALQTAIGYKELYAYFDQKIDLNTAIEEIKKNSRHYAKRQYTFFRHQLPVHWIDVDLHSFEHTIQEAITFIEEKKN